MYFDPNYAGHGVGTELLRTGNRNGIEIEDVEQIKPGVVSDDSQTIELYEMLQAIKLYKIVGFKTFGVQPNYFKDKEKYGHQQCMQLA